MAGANVRQSSAVHTPAAEVTYIESAKGATAFVTGGIAITAKTTAPWQTMAKR